MDRNGCPPWNDEYEEGSLSARRAWIEMPIGSNARIGYRVALRKESVDRNNSRFVVFCPVNVSLSARRAWIEICDSARIYASRLVALRKESVDRNSWAARARVAQYVALRKESVDRNGLGDRRKNRASQVALRKESVDRNLFPLALSRRRTGRSPQGERG